jgi:hypothetical protein
MGLKDTYNRIKQKVDNVKRYLGGVKDNAVDTVKMQPSGTAASQVKIKDVKNTSPGYTSTSPTPPSYSNKPNVSNTNKNTGSKGSSSGGGSRSGSSNINSNAITGNPSGNLQQIANKAAENKQSRITPVSYNQLKKGQSVIGPAVSLSQREKEKLSKQNYGKEVYRKATQEEKRRAGVSQGYNVGGYISPFWSGSGTIMGKDSDSAYMSIGEVQEFELSMAEMPIKIKQKKTIESVETELKPKYEKRVTENTTDKELEIINREYKEEVIKVSNKKLSEDKDYIGSIGKYTKISNEQPSYELTAIDKRKQRKESLIDFGAGMALPSITSFSKVLKETQENPTYYEAGPGTKTKYYNGYDKDSFKFGLSKEGKINFAVGTAFTVGGAYFGVEKVGRDITKLRIEQGLNAKSFTLGKLKYQTGKESGISTLTLKQTKYFKQATKIDSTIFAKGNNNFIIGPSKGKSVIVVDDFLKGIRQAKNPTLTSTKTFTAGGQGSVYDDLILGKSGITFKNPKGVKGFRGQAYAIVDNDVYDFTFQGASKQNKNYVKGFGGRITGKKAYLKDVTSFTEKDGYAQVSYRTSTKSNTDNVFKIFNKKSQSSDSVGGVINLGKGSQVYKQDSIIQSAGGFSSSVSSSMGKFAPQVTQSSMTYAPTISTRAFNFNAKSSPLQIKKTEIKQSPIMNIVSNNGMSSIIKPATKEKEEFYFIPKAETKDIFRNSNRQTNIPGIASITKTAQTDITKQISKGKATNINRIPPISPNFGVPFTGGFGFGLPSLGFPKLSLFDYGRKRSSKPKGFKGRYAPSITAIGLNIKSPAIPKLYTKGFGALSIRPLIGTTKRRKSKNGRRKKR